MELFLAFLTSCGITVFITPLSIKLARKFHLLDDPSTRPHPARSQNRIVPRAGGLPIYIAILTTTLIFLPLEKYLVGILSGITILLIIGLLDDKFTTFSPYKRLILLFLAALAVVSAGIGIAFSTNPLYGLPFLPQFLNTQYIHLDQFKISFNIFGPHQIYILADIFALIWIVTITQVINWSKGVDGQMPGITLIATLTLAFLSLRFYEQGASDQYNIAVLALVVAGTSLGFLIYNWHPAQMFPGFSGSTILAFMIAVLSILSGAKVATAILVLAVPFSDFIYTIFRRLLSGKSPVWGDRGHLHHRLLDLGWSHRQIALFYICGSAILGALALSMDTSSKIFAMLGVGIIFLSLILWLNSFGRS